VSPESQESLSAEDTDGFVSAEDDDDELVFAEEDSEGETEPHDSWKVLIVDDETTRPPTESRWV
jgi:hypothetical protein